MSLPSLDLRDMDSEMETAGIVGPTTGGSRGVGFQEQKPLQQACVSRKQDGLLPSSTLPCMALGLSRHQAGVSPPAIV